MSDIVIYEDGNLQLDLSIKDKTIWLDANDIAAVFDVNRPAIVKHIGNIYKSEELEKISTCSILEQVAKDGKKRKVNYYNLDIIISVGYRVNSKKATKFRKWSTSVLKEYISNGYAINTHKITEQRFQTLKSKVNKIDSLVISNTLEIKQGIFHDGQIYDAYVFVNDLLKSAKKEVVKS